VLVRKPDYLLHAESGRLEFSRKMRGRDARRRTCALPRRHYGVSTGEREGDMATDLKVSVRREIDRLREELAAATGRVAALQDEIRRHELVQDMLDGRKNGKRSRQGRSGAGALKRGHAVR